MCNVYQQDNTRATLSPHSMPAEAWRDVSVDQPGNPRPTFFPSQVMIDDLEAILERCECRSICAHARSTAHTSSHQQNKPLPGSKDCPNTSDEAVTAAHSEIYADYGQPDYHQTNNDPLFNSHGFAEFSQQHRIQHHKMYLYIPQSNPAEYLMRTLGKAMKAVYTTPKLL